MKRMFGFCCCASPGAGKAVTEASDARSASRRVELLFIPVSSCYGLFPCLMLVVFYERIKPGGTDPWSRDGVRWAGTTRLRPDGSEVRGGNAPTWGASSQIATMAAIRLPSASFGPV